MAGQIEGTITTITEEGDLITDIEFRKWSSAPRDSSVRIIVDDEHETFGVFPASHDQPTMTLIAIGDDEQPIRLVLVGDSASMMLGVRAGAPVRMVW